VPRLRSWWALFRQSVRPAQSTPTKLEPAQAPLRSKPTNAPTHTHTTARSPVLTHAKNHALREEMYRAYVTRASSGDGDNTPIINKVLALRGEKAKLLGFENFAELSMASKVRLSPLGWLAGGGLRTLTGWGVLLCSTGASHPSPPHPQTLPPTPPNKTTRWPP